jgi:FkbM family methyltransferase
MLADEESRLTLASIIKQRIRGEHGFLRIARYGEYFHPVCKALAGEWVVDAGACDGRTSLAFAHQATGGRVFAFEPDPANQAKIKAMLSKERETKDEHRVAAADSIIVAPHALYNEDTTVRFSGDRKGSSTIANGKDHGIEVSAIMLDSFVEMNAVSKVDLVSIDIEGAEAACLKGMRGVIERFRPKLQVSIYHKKADLFELPFLVGSMCNNYTMFLGHHNTYSTETDLYAVPNERLKI